jgi:cobalt-zinc-cadmium efflux system membrane fusion protein
VVRVIASFENTTAELFPGMFVAGAIHTGEKLVDALPEAAITIEGDQENYIYYTLDATGDPVIFHRIKVSTGYIEKEYVAIEVDEPLPEGALVVTGGSYYIRAEMLKGME